MINLDSIINENNKEYNKKWPYIPNHPYRILIIGRNTLLNLINEQGVIDKIYLYAKDFGEPKYEYLIKNRENAGINHYNNYKNYHNIHNIYKNHVVDGNVQ